MEEIRNRVAESSLITIDLEDFYPTGNRIIFDIKDWLFEGIILKEKDFRTSVKNYDWSQYENSFVALTCSTEAIIPSWAYLLITSQLSQFATKVIVGDLIQLESSIYQDIIADFSLEKFQNKPVIIKGCSNKPIPDSAYTELISKLVPVAKSIMFGEACSTVPLYKAR